jgi:formylglycine-generating enzyme
MRPRLSALLLALTASTLALVASPEEQTPPPSEVPVGMRLIPAGDFVMGHESPGDHNPTHRVRLRAFYLDRHEITNADFRRYCETTGRPMPEFWGLERFRSGPEFPDHPVLGISWLEATAFAKWAGKRLPTEAEWEYAGRGGLVGQDYPHGANIDATKARYADGKPDAPLPVGSFAANGFGLFDMSGNVAEWVADTYDAAYYASSPSDNPTGPPPGKFRVIRGGGWHSGPFCNRVYFRNALPANWRDLNVGFRCARDIAPASPTPPPSLPAAAKPHE